MRYPPGIGKPGGYGETDRQKPAQYRLGKPARPFATRPDISNPAGYGRADLHFCPPLFGIVQTGGKWVTMPMIRVKNQLPASPSSSSSMLSSASHHTKLRDTPFSAEPKVAEGDMTIMNLMRT